MFEHHPTCPPSSMPALASCPCYKPGPTGEAAATGRLLHTAVECLLTGKPAPVLDFDEAAQVEWANGWIREHTGPNRLVEERLTLLDDDWNVMTFGTADALDPAVPIVIDFKSGQIHDYRPQTDTYALMFMRRFSLKQTTVAVLYGRLRHVDSYTITLDEAYAAVMPILRRIADPARKPVPCDYCPWCGDRTTCPALIGMTREVILGRGGKPPETFHFSEITDPKAFAEIADKVRFARKVVEEAYKSMLFHGKKLIESGATVPGYALKDRKGKRAITDIMKAFESIGLPPDEFISACSASLPQLEKILAAHEGIKLAAAKRELQNRINGLISEGQPSKYLVPVKCEDEESEIDE